jgi:hypothetical protein
LCYKEGILEENTPCLVKFDNLVFIIAPILESEESEK